MKRCRDVTSEVDDVRGVVGGGSEELGRRADEDGGRGAVECEGRGKGAGECGGRGKGAGEGGCG